MEEIKEERKVAFKAKLKITDKRIIEFFKVNMKADKVAYNYAVETNLNEYKEIGALIDKRREELAAEGMSEEDMHDEIEELKSKLYKENVTKALKMNNMLTTLKNSDNHRFSVFKKATALARVGAIYFAYNTAFSKFLKESDKNKERVKKLKAKYPNRKYTYPYSYGFPKFKKRSDSFFLDNIPLDKVDYKNNKIYLPGLPKFLKAEYGIKHDGYVKIWKHRQLPQLSAQTLQLGLPVISTDGIDYFISFVHITEVLKQELDMNKVLGVDLGIKEVIATSDGDKIHSFGSNPKYIKMVQKKKYLQRALSKHLLSSPKLKDLTAKEKYYKENKTCKMKKLGLAIKKIQVKINNFLEYNRKYEVAQILKSNPSVLVLETLRVKGMFQSKLSRKLQEAAMSTVRTLLINQAKLRGITVVKVPATFASSQLCNKCGYQYPKMKDLSRRTFVCPVCGHTDDRDINAAKNLRDNAHIAEEIK